MIVHAVFRYDVPRLNCQHLALGVGTSYLNIALTLVSHLYYWYK